MQLGVDEMLMSTYVHVPEKTPLRVVRHADDEVVSVRFGSDELLNLGLDDAMVPVLVEALRSAQDMSAE